MIFTLQIADFGMARDVSDDTYYMSTGGKIPVVWTAPEVRQAMYFRHGLIYCTFISLINTNEMTYCTL